MSKIAVAGSVLAAALSGVMTRPCCVLPVALSTLGLSSAVVAPFMAKYQPVLLGASLTLLAASLVLTLRRQGGTASKVIAVTMSIASFIVTQVWAGVF